MPAADLPHVRIAKCVDAELGFTAESQVKKLKRLQRGEAFDRMGLGKLRTLKESARAPAGDDFLALGFIKKSEGHSEFEMSSSLLL